MRIVSIEPLSEESIINIKKVSNEDIQYIAREEIDNLVEDLATTEILICRDRDLNIAFLEHLVCLKWIFIVSNGVDKLPFAYLAERNIQVVNSPNISNDAMSDYVMGAILMHTCRFNELLEYQRESYWKPYAMTESLRGKNLLIVGAGKIGKDIAYKANAFGMNVDGICRVEKHIDVFRQIKGISELYKMCAEADFVVCTLPLTAETKYCFNEKVFKCMKKTAIFINISRGAVVNTNELIQCLKDKVIGGAVLDVFEIEPLAKESELWNLDNVVITPHSSGRIDNYFGYVMEIFKANLCSYKEEGKLINQVDLIKGY